MTTVYRKGSWWFSPMLRAFHYVPAGNYEQGVDLSEFVSLTIDWSEAMDLVPELERYGLLQPRMDEKLHVEDLKVTHRLIDLLDKAIG